MRSVLLIGLGRFGRYTAQKLNELNVQVMAVDKDEQRVNKVLGYVTNALIGDSTDQNFLKSLGINDYDVCIVAIGDDFISSLETTSLLHEMGAKKVISRATGMSQEKFLLRNGADVVVFPERDLANETAIRASSSSVSDYMNLEGEYAIFEIRVPESWYGKTVASLSIRNVYRVNVLGIRKDGVMNMHVTGDTVMEKGASVMVLGKEAELFKSFHLAE